MKGTKTMNILLTSVGRRSYLVKYFKDALGTSGEVHVSNSHSLSPAFNSADNSVITPLIYDSNYIPFLLNYCKEYKINAIISLFDIDLRILSLNRHEFERLGIKVVVSNTDVISICNDKWETYRFLKRNGLNVPKTFQSINMVKEAFDRQEVNYPLIIKPRWGMGSIAIYEAENDEELKVFYNKTRRDIMNTYLKYESKDQIDHGVIIQEKIFGQEYGLDVINDLNGQYCNTIVKRKYAMRGGETDCAEIVSDPNLKNLGMILSAKLRHIGNLDVDIFLKENIPIILEMNARFGGGYPFSHIAEVNLPLAIIKWLKGEVVENDLLTEKFGVLGHKDIEIIKLYQ